MRTHNRLLLTFLLLLGICASKSAFAQGRVNRYTVSTFTGSFSSISSTGTSLSLTGDDNVKTFSSPFDFNFDSTLYTGGSTWTVCTNGWVVLFSTTSNTNADVVGTTGKAPGFMPFSMDGYVVTGTYYALTGTAPNRVYTLEWTGYRYWTGQTTTTSLQMKLYETTNVIEFLYADHSFTFNGYGGVGINGNTSPTFLYQRYGSNSNTTPSSDVRFTPPAPPVPPSQLSLSPKTLNFGSAIAGQSTTLCVSAQSLGPANLKIAGLALSGNPDFSIVPGGKQAGDSILAGQNSQYCIKFSPIASGTRTATFSLSTNGRDSGIQNVTLVGTGIAPGASYSVNALYRKSYTKIGDTAKPQYFYVTSNGTGPLTINSITIGGLNPDNYFISRFPATTIPTGVTDSVGVTFVPKFEGRPDATVYLNDNALNAPNDTVRLFGTGILPRLALSTLSGTPGLLRFDSVSVGDSVCQTVTVYNPGSDTVRITRQQKTSGDFDFSFYPLTGSDTAIAPSQSKPFNVCFKPLKNGYRTATYRFYTNIPKTYPAGADTSQVILTISGVGVPTGRLTFSGPMVDTSVIGTKICNDDVITNAGQTDMTVTSLTITGANASDFSFTTTPAPPFTLAAGTSQTVNVCFTPSGRASRVGLITVVGTTNGKSQTISVPIAGYGLQLCAQAAPSSLFASAPTMLGSTDSGTVTVTNCGDVATSYTTALTGAGYTVTPTTSAVIAPGGTTTFTVHYTPTTIGTNAGTLTVNGGTGITPMTVTLGGAGGGVTLSATSETPTVMVGNCQNFNVTVTNNGNVPWTVGAGNLTGADAADFTPVSAPTTIAPGASGTFVVKFCATRVGDESATGSATGSPAPTPAFTFTVHGTGIASGVSAPSYSKGFELDQSYPNPSNASAQVRFVLPNDAAVRLELIDATGATVKTVANERMTSGEHTLTIDAHDLASGTYFYVLTSGDVRLMKQMLLVK